MRAELNFKLYDNYLEAAGRLDLTIIKTTSIYQIKEAKERGFQSYLWLPTNKICEEIYNRTKVVNGKVLPIDESSIDGLLNDLRHNFCDFHLEFSKNYNFSNHFNANRFYGTDLTIDQIVDDFETMLSDEKWTKESITAEKFDLLELLDQ